MYFNIYFKIAKPLASYKQSHRSSIYRKKKNKGSFGKKKVSSFES